MNILDVARKVLSIEAEAVLALTQRLDSSFEKAIDIIYASSGRVVVTGMGKSGLVGKKIAATLASTGTPSFFMHPAEASHGDLGMVTSDDAIIAISNSGETDEIVALIPFLKRFNVGLVSLTGNPNSTLARASDVSLDISVREEACPLGIVPTASTTVTLAMGDAIAVALRAGAPVLVRESLFRKVDIPDDEHSLEIDWSTQDESDSSLLSPL